MRRMWASVVLLAGLVAGPARADETLVAVAANFTAAAKDIGAAFAEQSGHRAVFSFGSTGQLYAQITQGAPFQVFLAADAVRPLAAEQAGLAAPGSRFTYSVGRLALWSADAAAIDDQGRALSSGGFDKIAVANPAAAPYGAAAVQTMRALGVYDAVAAKIVYGANIAQTHQFIASGAARLGFVAWAQIVLDGSGSHWLVPAHLHDPIAQDAVLLKTGAHSAAALAFMDFLKSPQAAAIIRRYGYAVPARE